MQTQPDELGPAQLARLQEDAKEILDRMRQNKWERPIFIEFSGTPKSGKSTCIDIVAHFFRRMKFKTLAPSEGASKRTPYYLKDDLVAFNAWSLSYALTHIFEGLYSSDRYDIAILDRGLFDALVWFELLASRSNIPAEQQGKKNISETDRETIQRFILLDKWRSVIDKVFLFKADPETSLSREHQDKLVEAEGNVARAMNPTFLTELNAAYDSTRAKYAAEFRSFEYIDTSTGQVITPKQTAFHVAQGILEVLRQS